MKRRMTGRSVMSAAVGLAALVAGALLPTGAQAQQADPYEWAALGDSYTAGLFVGDPQPPLGSPDRDGCDRTTNSYPGLVQRALDAEPPGESVELTDVSCGGAAIEHIAESNQQPLSPVEAPADGWAEVARRSSGPGWTRPPTWSPSASVGTPWASPRSFSAASWTA